jgi:hypothetical protein
MSGWGQTSASAADDGSQAVVGVDPPPQVAPFNLHDVVQVTGVPFMQALQTSTHWSSFVAS